MSALAQCAQCTTRYAHNLNGCPHCGSADRAPERTGSALPYLDVDCRTENCPAVNQVRRVYLRAVLPGVVEAPQLLLCRCCWAPMHLGPLVLGPRTKENGMPKITRLGGASNAAEGTEHSLTDEGPDEGPDEALPLADDTEETEQQAKKPRRRTKARPADEAAAALEVTAEAEVTRSESEGATS